MAKAAATPQADVAAAPKSGKKLLIILLVLVLVVLLALGGLVVLLLLKKSGGGGSADAEHEQTQAPAGAPAHAALDLSHPPTFVTLEPFVVNLAPEEGDRYLQVALALRVGDTKTGDALKAFMPAIRHSINLLLSSKLPSQLATLDGREDLADEIVEQVNITLGYAPPPASRRSAAPAPAGPIQAVMFTSFIIQ